MSDYHREIKQRALVHALKKVREACDLLDMPAFILGDELDGEVMYGVVIGSRALATRFSEKEKHIVIAGMINSQKAGEVESFH